MAKTWGFRYSLSYGFLCLGFERLGWVYGAGCWSVGQRTGVLPPEGFRISPYCSTFAIFRKSLYLRNLQAKVHLFRYFPQLQDLQRVRTFS